jgi:hypothetical protein
LAAGISLYLSIRQYSALPFYHALIHTGLLHIFYNIHQSSDFWYCSQDTSNFYLLIQLHII